MKKIISLLLMILILTNLYACSSDQVTITFDTDGGETLEAIQIDKETATMLPLSSKDGYRFIGWVDETDEHITSVDIIEEDVTLRAIYEPVQTIDYQGFENSTNPIVTIEVKYFGIMQIELFPDVAPNTVNNFINLVNSGYFDGMVFHRVIRNFMIQGGHNPDTTCAIVGEFASNGIENDLLHLRGVISMARTNDPNSATGQFFVMHQNSPHLNENYAAFGTLISGFNVLDRIASVPTTGDAPQYEVLIATAYVETFGVDYDEPVCYN